MIVAIGLFLAAVLVAVPLLAPRSRRARSADHAGACQMRALAITAALLVAPMHCDAPATSTVTSTKGRCTQFEPLLAELAPAGGWDVARMSRLMHRESRCQPGVRSRTRDSGLLQINDINHRFLRGRLGEHVDRWTLQNPRQNIRAAAALCEFWRHRGGCYLPWATS